ncbi:MAG: hypothetical protein D6724_10210 [Armatimonadetes bacterium]|nr:MAG: hypothetical protein D6724_10210 [Armatimonadota bacterium]
MSALSHPEVRTATAVRSRRVAVTVGNTLTLFLVSFGVFLLLLHVFVGLLGHGALEQSRRRQQDYRATAQAVEECARAVQRKTDRIMNPLSVDAWARLHSYRSAYLVNREQEQVE